MTALVSSLRRSAPRYEPADGTYRAAAAPLWRRGVASAVDWVLVFLCFLIAGYPLGMIQTVGDAIGGITADIVFLLTQIIGAGVVVAYFAYFFATGHTLGMRALDIHVFSARTGRDPHLVRASVRAVLSFAFFLAAVDAYGLSRGAYAEDLTDEQGLWRTVALTVTAVAVAGQLWKIVDPAGKTLWDRLTGLVVVEDVVPTSMPDRLWSPWGT
jgi:uncharacterized RDD family membrane protein YckC